MIKGVEERKGSLFMADNKKQHFVPKLYLHNFTRDGHFLSLYDVENCKTVPDAPYKDQCYKNYYYGRDAVLEKKLSEKETEWGALFQRILAGNQLSDKDLYLIRQFVIYQLHRTVASNEFAIKQQEEVLIEQMKIICAHRGFPFNETVKNICRERARNGLTPAKLLADSDQYVLYIQDLSILIIDYQTNSELITSDVPVVAINPFCPHTIGYAMMGIIILFPINSHKLVVLYDSKMYPAFRGTSFACSSDETEVRNLNTLEFISADRLIFAESEQPFSQFTEAAWDARRQNRERNTTTSFGNENGRMILTQPRKVIYNCEFSFGRLSHQFRRVPPECREAPSRKWDPKWEKKLDMKEEIMLNIMNSAPNLDGRSLLSRKELRRGYRKMASAAKVYWSQGNNT